MKKRQDSRHWWRRIQSRKYRTVLVKKSAQVAIVTAVMFLLAHLNSDWNYLCLIAWCLIVGIILIRLKKNLQGMESKEQPKAQQTSRRLSQPQEVEEPSQQTNKVPAYRIKEIPSKNINAESKETESQGT